MERKRVALKHKEYADKIRGKAKVYAEYTIFITWDKQIKPNESKKHFLWFEFLSI